MIIFWGWRTQEKRLHSGAFFCPNCASDSTYSRYWVGRYFTLYGITLFRTRIVAEYVKCRVCRSTFSPAVLRISRDELQAASEPWACAQCGNLNAASALDCLACHTRRAEEKVVVPRLETQPRRVAVDPTPSSLRRRRRTPGSKYDY